MTDYLDLRLYIDVRCGAPGTDVVGLPFAQTESRDSRNFSSSPGCMCTACSE